MVDMLTATEQRTDIARFNDWLQKAQVGDRYEYHRGLLAADRPAAFARVADVMPRQRAVSDIADHVLRFESRGIVYLVQQRHGKFDASYLAVKAAR